MDNTHHKRLKGINDACPRDRVSELPDPIIHHILSFLETKFVVRTSILCKRWRYIWATMPTFDLLLAQGHQELQTKTFENFIEKMFAVRQRSFNMTRFTLKSDEHLDAYKVYEWISALVRCNIEELNLAFSVDKPIQLPISLFTCESLLKLTLQLNICLRLPTSISIPKLKLLQLSDIGLDTSLAEKLILEAPLLEDLVLSNCSWSDWNQSTLHISAPALKYFRFHDPLTDHDGRVRSGTVKIYAPILRHLTCTGNIAKDYILSSFPSLDGAEVGFKFKRKHFKTKGAEIGHAASKLVGALSNVTSLTISGGTLEALSFANDDLPAFPNLTHLTVTSKCKSLADKVLLEFFHGAPNLESLVFDEGLPMSTTIEAVFWNLTIACPFARLKSLHLKEFAWHLRELDFIEVVVKNAEVLEKVTLGTTTAELSNILAQIESMRKATTPYEPSEWEAAWHTPWWDLKLM